MATEKERLEEARQNEKLWKKWGPYLSERQWGTVREDYSDNGDAWNYFTHDQPARGPIAGARTVWPEFPTTSSSSVLRWPSGTGKTRSSRNVSSGSPTAKATTARTSKNITSTSTARRRIPT